MSIARFNPTAATAAVSAVLMVVLAAVLTSGQTANAAPGTYSPEVDGIHLSAPLEDGGHVNVITTVGSFGIHPEAKCVPVPSAVDHPECLGHPHDVALLIGQTLIPYSIFGAGVDLTTIQWIQVSGENCHWDNRTTPPTVCKPPTTAPPTSTAPPTGSPSPTPTLTATPTPTSTPTVTATPTPTATATVPPVTCPAGQEVSNDTCQPADEPNPEQTAILGTPPRNTPPPTHTVEPTDVLAQTAMNIDPEVGGRIVAGIIVLGGLLILMGIMIDARRKTNPIRRTGK